VMAVLTKRIDDLGTTTKSIQQQLTSGYDLLSRALRARDAEAMLKEADQKVIDLGDKLLDARHQDDSAWAIDFQEWKRYLTQIDHLMASWDKSYRPSLDIRQHDYEAGAPTAPKHIVDKQDANSTRYKTVWIAQSTYKERRDNLFAYLGRKANDF